MANMLLSGYRCLLGHLNMSPAALEQCVAEIFTNQSIDNIQRIRRHSSYHKTNNIPKGITALCKSFNTGVTLALDQLIARNIHNGRYYLLFFKYQFNTKMYFQECITTAKYSLEEQGKRYFL